VLVGVKFPALCLYGKDVLRRKFRSAQVQATFEKMFREDGEDEIKECKLVLDEGAVETKP
jgi:hypothetical protein